MEVDKEAKSIKGKAKIGGRAPNYTFAEKQMLLQLVESRKHIIENKKTDGVSMEEKNQVWQNLTKEFNSLSPAMIPRTCESLKKYYNNMKEDLRKRLGNEKKEIYKTGGGGPPPPAERDNADKFLMSIVNKKSLYGVPASISPYDDDYIEPKNNWSIEPMISGNETEEGESQSLLEPRRHTAKLEPIPSSTLHILKTPLDVNLKAAIDKDPGSYMNKNNIEIIMDMDHSEDHTNAQENRNEPLKENFTTKIKKGSGIKKSGVSSRRRPTIIKTLTSSKLGELYERLIEKKLELLDGLRKEHTQRMKVLELDEKVKVAQLNRILQAKPIHQTPQTLDIDTLIGESIDFTL